MRNKFMLICLVVLLITGSYCVSVNAEEQKEFKLKPLPYEYDALEPYIDKETMKLHHDKHEGAYVDNLNKALEKHPELYGKTLEELLRNLDSIPEDIREQVRNNAGGVFNHDFFWSIMGKNKGGEPDGKLKQEIDKQFGSFEKFKSKFKEEGLKRFGSGWVWLLSDKDGKLIIMSTPNQDEPHLNLKPIITLDLWEHAYYLKYQNRRGEYIDNWWNIVNWDKAEENYK